jgi:hypothetical protein
MYKGVKKMSKMDYKRVLIVCHDFSIKYIKKIISNIDIYNKYDKDIGNCAIMSCYYNKKFSLVTEPNNDHLTK